MLRTTASFLSETKGNVATLFGLSLLPLSLMVGAAIDYTGASTMRGKLQKSVDAATLELCQTSANLTVANLRTLAQTSLNERFPAATTITDLQTQSVPRAITLSAKAAYPTTFMQLANMPTISVSATASCSASETYFEIALVLDTTGSMKNSGKITSAKTAATNFVNYMFSTGAMPGHVRMSLVPFAATVAVPTSYRTAAWMDSKGNSPLHWQYITNPVSNSTNPKTNFGSRFAIFDQLKSKNSSWGWAGCVESPPYPYNVNDNAVSSAVPASLIVPSFAIDELTDIKVTKNGKTTTYSYNSNNTYINDGYATGSSATCRSDDTAQSALPTRLTQACKYQEPASIQSSAAGPNWMCSSRPLSILGTGQSTLLSEINQLQPDGNTDIHEGFMWGWRTISPTSVFSGETSPPVSYAQTVPQGGLPVYKKIIVLMTDGANTWTADSSMALGSYYSAYGYFKKADGTDPASANSRFIPGRKSLSTSSDGRAAIDELVSASCTNAKAKGVIVYTVGFSTKSDPIDQQGQDLLKNCATGNNYYFLATDGDALVTAFDTISKSIGSLRLTR